MPSVVYLFRQAYVRDLATALGSAIADLAQVAVVSSISELTAAVVGKEVDIVVMGSSFIDSAERLRIAVASKPDLMLITLDREEDYSIHQRAEMHGIDAVVSIADGVQAAIEGVHAAWHRFLSRASTAHDQVALSTQPEGRILVVDDVDRSIIRLIAAGFVDREIADAVYLSNQTVRNRVSRILADAGARNRTHLAAIYLVMVHEGTIPFVTDDGHVKVA